MLGFEIVKLYRECGSIRETARRLSVSAVQGGRRTFASELGGHQGHPGQGHPGNEALGSLKETSPSPLPVDLPRGQNQVQVFGLQLRAFRGQRAVFRGVGDGVAEGVGDRGGGPVARGPGV